MQVLDLLISTETQWLRYMLHYFKTSCVVQENMDAIASDSKKAALSPNNPLRMWEMSSTRGSGSKSTASAVVEALEDLSAKIAALHKKSLFPYNPTPLLRWMHGHLTYLKRAQRSNHGANEVGSTAEGEQTTHVAEKPPPRKRPSLRQ